MLARQLDNDDYSAYADHYGCVKKSREDRLGHVRPNLFSTAAVATGSHRLSS